ncbi:MAG: hypothetical protein WDW38_010296 [Sanguina aurantia]
MCSPHAIAYGTACVACPLVSPSAAALSIAAVDEAVQAAYRREQMSHLCPCTRSSATRQAAGQQPDISSLSRLMAGASLGGSVNANGKADGTFDGHDSVAIVASCLAAATVKAMTTVPRMDVLKLRFNFGKALFYNDARMGGAMRANVLQTLSQLKAFRIGKDLKSVYSNGATAGQVCSVTSWLKGEGFSRGSDKQTVSLHVTDVDANASYNIAMDAMPGGLLSIRKIKTASTKVCFVTSIRPQDQLDARFKVLGHYTTQLDPDVAAKLRGVGKQCRIDLSRNKLDTPNLGCVGLTRQHCRIKSKQVYNGSLRQTGAMDIGIKISVVTCVTDEGTHCEIQGVSEPLNDLLLQLHAAGNSSAQAAREVSAVVPRILKWCDKLSAQCAA